MRGSNSWTGGVFAVQMATGSSCKNLSLDFVRLPEPLLSSILVIHGPTGPLQPILHPLLQISVTTGKTSLFYLTILGSVRVSTNHLGASYQYVCLILQQEHLVEPVGGKAQSATWDAESFKDRNWPRNSRNCLEGLFRSFWLSHLDKSSCTNNQIFCWKVVYLGSQSPCSK